MTTAPNIPHLKVLIAERSAVEWRRICNLVEGVDKLDVACVAHKGSTLTEALVAVHPDVLVINIDTPERKGINLLKLVRAGHPSMPIIVLSSSSSTIYTRICKAAGASYVFDKSTEFHLLAPLLGMFADRLFSSLTEKQ
jgi:DNA-binding NarL/FixJ family response regulator